MAGELQIPEGWTIQTIGGLGKVVTGKTPSTRVPDNFGGDIPFITPSDMNGRRIISHTARYLTNKGATSVSSARIPAGAVMVSCIGSDMGKAAIAGCNAVTNQQINSIVVREGISSLYAYYNLSARQDEIKHIGSGGSAVPILNKGHFCQLQIALPPLRTQRAIACILGALDDKIELNRRMNRTLEEMARAIFKSWFVDFDPVRAKAAGQQPPGLKPEIAALFPDSFEDSELGEIPKGWRVGTIQECCEQMQNGGTPRRNEPRYWDGGNIPWLTSGEVRQSIITATDSFITEQGLAESSAKWVPAFATVVALYGATAGQVSFTACRLTTNQAVCALIPRTGYAFYNYQAMCRSTSEMENKAVGSAQQNISKGIVEKTHMILPPAKVVQRFSKVASSVFEHWILNVQQSRTLAAFRDALLPKLLSGELRVPDAEHIVGRVV